MSKIKVVLRKTHETKNGKYPLCVRVTNPKTVYLQVKGIYMTDKEYSSIFLSNRPTREALELRQCFEAYTRRAIQILDILKPFDEKELRRLFNDKSFNPAEVKQETSQSSLKLSEMFDYCIQSKLQNAKIGESTANNYRYVLRKLLAFQPEVSVTEINSEWLSRFEQNFFENCLFRRY